MKTKNLEIHELDNNRLPLLSTVIKGQKLCQTYQINFILGIGGGCCMDLAKAIAYTSAYNDNVDNLLTNQISDPMHLPFATIVTYPSSGSETNGSAQIYDKQKEEHIGIQGIYPDFTWLNVEYIKALSPSQLTWAYMTSFIQLSIQYIGLARNKIKESLIESLIQSILFNLDKIHDNQIAEDVYIDLLCISAFSSNSIFNKNGDFSIYPISALIQDHFNISYAQALTVLYPYWFKQIAQESELFDQYRQIVFEKQDEIIQQFHNLYKHYDIPISLDSMGAVKDSEVSLKNKVKNINEIHSQYMNFTQSKIYKLLETTIKGEEHEIN